jgi:hypothetical protein
MDLFLMSRHRLSSPLSGAAQPDRAIGGRDIQAIVIAGAARRMAAKHI